MRALADPTRRRIIQLVRSREVAAAELAASFELTRPAISQHLKVLVDANLITVRKKGRQRLYNVRQESLKALFLNLDDYWSLGLLRLQLAAEARAGNTLK